MSYQIWVAEESLFRQQILMGQKVTKTNNIILLLPLLLLLSMPSSSGIREISPIIVNAPIPIHQ